MSPLRTILRRHGRWLLLVAASFLGLGLVELTVRLLRWAPPVHAIWVEGDDNFYTRSTNGILGYEIRPDFTKDLPRGKATSNSHGLRDLPRTVAKPDGVRRILLLGDSVVEGIGFVPDQDTLSSKLKELYPDDKTEVLNFGTSGYCTRAEVELLAQKGVAFQPDLVVLLFVINDYNNYTPELTMEGGIVDRPGWSKQLFLRSHLFRHLSLRWNWFEFGAEIDPIAWNRQAIGGNNVVDGLALLRELANRHDFRVVICAWPVFGEANITYPNRSDTEQLLIQRLAAANGLPFRRMDQSFRSYWQNTAPDSNPRQTWTVNQDGMHPNGDCAAIAAMILRLFIENTIPLPPYSPGAPDPQAERLAAALSGVPDIPATTFEQRRYRLLIYHDRYDEAYDYLHQLLREDPNHPWANHFLGRQLVRHGKRHEEALPFLETALKLDPRQVESRVIIAQILSARNQSDEAVKLLQQGLALSPYEPNLHFALGGVCLTNNQLQLAEKHLTTARELAPQNEGLTNLFHQLESRKKKARFSEPGPPRCCTPTKSDQRNLTKEPDALTPQMADNLMSPLITLTGFLSAEPGAIATSAALAFTAIHGHGQGPIFKFLSIGGHGLVGL